MQDIVSDFPDYLDAYMRLACIERKQGNLKKAIEWAEKGVNRAEACSKGSSSHSDLLAMTGQFCGVCQCVCDLQEAQVCTFVCFVHHTCLPKHMRSTPSTLHFFVEHSARLAA